MRAIDPALFPNVVGALRESGLDPTRELVPVAPAAHYGMGGIVTDLDGAHAPCPASTRSARRACTGPARRQPPGLQLAERVLRLRRAAPSFAALDEPRAAAGDAARARRAARAADARDARGALARRRASSATPTGSSACVDDPHPLARLVARHALLREESRGAQTRSDFPETDAALDLHHSVTRGGADEPAFERWV